MTPAREGGSECTVGTRVGVTVGKGGGRGLVPAREGGSECTVGTRVGATVARGGSSEGCRSTDGVDVVRLGVRAVGERRLGWRVDLREVVHHGLLALEDRGAEVDDAEGAREVVLDQHDVLRLEVAVDDALLVQPRDGEEHLAQEAPAEVAFDVHELAALGLHRLRVLHAQRRGDDGRHGAAAVEEVVERLARHLHPHPGLVRPDRGRELLLDRREIHRSEVLRHAGQACCAHQAPAVSS